MQSANHNLYTCKAQFAHYVLDPLRMSPTTAQLIEHCAAEAQHDQNYYFTTFMPILQLFLLIPLIIFENFPSVSSL